MSTSARFIDSFNRAMDAVDGILEESRKLREKFEVGASRAQEMLDFLDKSLSEAVPDAPKPEKRVVILTRIRDTIGRIPLFRFADSDAEFIRKTSALAYDRNLLTSSLVTELLEKAGPANLEIQIVPEQP